MSTTNKQQVRVVMPAPFESIVITVNPAIDGRTGKFITDTIGIMDTTIGEGTRGSLQYAEAEAKAVLRAIRKYRKLNPDE